MEPISQHNSAYQEFYHKIKAKLKKQKQQRKQFLRPITQYKYVESSGQENQEQYAKKTGNRWWNKINRNYFKPMNEILYTNILSLMTSQDILAFPNQSPLLSYYYQQIICAKNPLIFLDDSLRVIFRHEYRIDQIQKNQIVSFLVRPKSSKHSKSIQKPQKTILPPNTRIHTFHTIQQTTAQNVQKNIRKQQQIAEIINKDNVDLVLFDKTDDEEYIKKCLKYEEIWRRQEMTEVEKQIQCWQDQLNIQHRKNIEMFQALEKQFGKQEKIEEKVKNIHSQEQLIKKYLYANQTLMYFKSGYSDKIPDQLEKAVKYLKELDQQAESEDQNKQKKIIPIKQRKKSVNRKPFQTDCKICFCTKNQHINQVIYCDGCNTSFHQSCYGLQSFDEKATFFFCDVCIYMKKISPDSKGSSSSKLDPPCCQICCRSRFPMKQIDDHFYHVACLILFNFAEIRDCKIILRPGITHSIILDYVIENQVDNDACQFCINKNGYSGMKFHCSNSLCAKCYHPICAYLNGCKFSISRKEDNWIHAEIQCRQCCDDYRQHFTELKQELYYQVYIRRFLCNFKSTTDLNEIQFNEMYDKQLEKLHKNIKNNEVQFGPKKILKITPSCTNWIEKRIQKQKIETQKKFQSMLKKNSQSNSFHSQSANDNKQEQSQIKNMIKDLQKKKKSFQ